MAEAAKDDDPFDLGRFIEAQARVYETACDELHNGASRAIGCGSYFRK